MIAKKSKGDGVFNKRNGLKDERGKMTGTPKVVQKQKMLPTKNTGSVNSLDMKMANPEIFTNGHKKLTGSLMSDLQGGNNMANTFGKKENQPRVPQDVGMQPARGKKMAKKGY